MIKKKKIVITKEDLEIPVKKYPKVSSILSHKAEYLAKQKGQGISGGLVASNITQNLVAGLIGGIIAWIFSEIFFGDRSTYTTHTTMATILKNMSIWGGIIGASIGCTLCAAEGVVTKVSQKIFSGILVGLGFGFMAGLAGGFVGQFLYSTFGGGVSQNIIKQIFARTIGWGILGGLIGIAQGISVGSGKKMLNGIIGGLIGGGAGGLLFDIIGPIAGSGIVSRFISLLSMGACIGYGIGLAEELRKSAWLKVVEGFMQGKEFILYKNITSIGNATKNDIVLSRDKMVAPRHAIIQLSQTGFTIKKMNPDFELRVNERETQVARLKTGDILHIGKTVITYNEKNLPSQRNN